MNIIQYKTPKVIKEAHRQNMLDKLNLTNTEYDFNKTVIYERQKVLSNIINLINDRMDIDIRSKERTHPIPDGKKIYCKLAKEHDCLFSSEEIATGIGITHATVLHHLNYFESIPKTYKDIYKELKSVINNKRTEKQKRDNALKLALYYRKKLNKLSLCK